MQYQSITGENIRKNQSHYDQLYDSVNVDKIVDKVHNLHVFLDDAIRTDTSWHGLYQHDLVRRLKQAEVLELGCGDGLNALVMASLGARVTANDISAISGRIISEASAKLGINSVTPVCGDFAALEFGRKSFDFVIGKSVLHHLTHELELVYLRKVARMLKPGGEARFFEPAVNNLYLDKLRWMIPVPGRPSMLSRKRFAQWKQHDPHPGRNNSSAHYGQVGRSLFREVEIVPLGSLERLCRLMPRGQWTRRYRRLAHRIETRLPSWFRNTAARSQLIVYRLPIAEAEHDEAPRLPQLNGRGA